MKVIVIEDDDNIVKSLQLLLRMRWPEAEYISSHLGEEGLYLIETYQPDVVVLDLGLPDINGFEVLRQLRLFSEVPVIILTVLGDEDDIVKGLEMGANDYIVKPFKKMEFLARVKSLVRNQRSVYGGDTFQKGAYRLDIPNHKLYFKGRKITLTKNESLIFHMLLRNSNTVVTYSSIAKELWGDEYPGSTEAIRVYIQRLRHKIEAGPDHLKLIETKFGMGYVLNLPMNHEAK